MIIIIPVVLNDQAMMQQIAIYFGHDVIYSVFESVLVSYCGLDYHGLGAKGCHGDPM
jgi:hypothetical protein